MKIEKKQEPYIIKSWVCDYGVYDTYNNEFVSIPLGLASAKKVLDIYNEYIKG